MKKTLAVLLALVMVLSLAACGDDPAPAKENYKLGLGVYAYATGTAASEDEDGLAQADSVAAAIVVDKDGKIVAATIDAVQDKVSFTDKGVVLGKDASFKTKKEKKEEYGMQVASGLKEGEWYQQIAAFEKYIIGMTKDDVAKIALKDGRYPADEKLTAGCTMAITDFIKAVTDAFGKLEDCGSSKDVRLGIVSDAVSSTDANEDEDGVAFVTATYCAAVLDGGKIAKAAIDCTQTKMTTTFDGKCIAPETIVTKKDQKEKYNMQVASSLKEGEWYQQIAAFEKYVVGMDKAAVSAIPLKEGGRYPADEKLTAGCTMAVCDFINGLVKVF